MKMKENGDLKTPKFLKVKRAIRLRAAANVRTRRSYIARKQRRYEHCTSGTQISTSIPVWMGLRPSASALLTRTAESRALGPRRPSHVRIALRIVTTGIYIIIELYSGIILLQSRDTVKRRIAALHPATPCLSNCRTLPVQLLLHGSYIPVIIRYVASCTTGR